MLKLILIISIYFTLWNDVFSQKIANLEIPQINSSDIVVHHSGFSLDFSAFYKQSIWVAYELTKQKTNSIVERINKFSNDPDIYCSMETNNDYSHSGFDKGHLAPAADMCWSLKSMNESFYYSNICPQVPGFNRGIWKCLEELVRNWAIEYNSVYIVTGPVLTHGLTSIGNKIAIPKYFYKVVLDYQKSQSKGIGFIMPNSPSSKPLKYYAVSIDSVERFTGINFFPLLPDEVENRIEKNYCLSCWKWQIIKTSTTDNKKTTVKSVQCSATTNSGKQCKRMTKNLTRKCNQHQGKY
jgi:endonuclease G, mitochondrial